MTDVRIVTDALGGTALSQMLQRGEAPTAWGMAAPRSPEAWRQRALSRLREREWEECWPALEPAFAASGLAAERLDRVRREGGVIVTTGQQPGLFGGPVYTWSKAMGALALAEALERETGIVTIAVFWAATDDADFEEASSTVVARNGGSLTLESTHAPPPGTPMSLAPLGDLTHMRALLREAARSSADPRPLQAVERAYSDPARTVGDAYVALLRELLAPLGMPVIDASHPAVRTASDAILRVALRKAAVIEQALEARSGEIRAAGFEPQVVDVAGLSLAFTRDGTIKRRIRVDEASRVADDSEAWLTPNVLLRPIVEQAILPTVAYLGGPGELAYFAQVSAVADAVGIAGPLALPRWSCTLIEPHVARILERLAVEPEALAEPDALEGAVARAAMSHESAEMLGRLRRTIETIPGALAPEADPLGLTGAVQGSMQSLLHRVDRLERRLIAGVKRREHELLRDVATVRAALRPNRARQERALNLMPILSRQGLDLLGELRDAAAPHAASLLGSRPSR